MGISVHPEARALIFDLDGTLSNSLPVHVETWKIVGEKYGFDFDPKIILEMTGRPTLEFAKRIINQYGLNEQPENLVRLKQKSFWELAHLLEPVQEVIDIVNSYHGKLPMSVGTGASGKSAKVQLEALGISDCFEIVVAADDVQNHKPHPETFVKCAQLMNVKPQHCQVFEDGDLGISAAKTAGMFVSDVREHINYGEWAVNK
jgi:beta-phosphoglucomutase family hydrolase